MAGICDSLANTLSRAGIPQAAMAVNDSPAFPPSPAPSSTAAVRRNHQRLLWTGFAALLSLAIGAPVFAILVNPFRPAAGVWQHLIATVLPEMIANTAMPMADVGAGTQTEQEACRGKRGPYG